MILSEAAEEILEAMWVQIVEKKHADCDVAIFKDDAALKQLIGERLVALRGDMASLTDTGRAEAMGCIRRHRLAERLLVDVLAVKKPLVHETSCTFEHLLHKGLDESICTLLGHPRSCPHGRPIPEGRCCEEARHSAGTIMVPLSELDPSHRAVVAYLHTHDREALQKLIAMGLLPKTEVELVQKHPAFVLQIGKSQFALDDKLASYVVVRRQPRK